MALFEFENGQLIPAQFGYPIADGLSAEVTDAICSQVLEIVSRPLFPITWNNISRISEENAQMSRLTALDAAGQVVSVEVMAHLDSQTLIASLSRLAEAASLSWSDLAREHPGGVEGFTHGWIRFRDAMPPSAGAGPRLVMVVGSIDSQVRPALDVLATSGVEVHEVSVRRMTNGRTFLEVQEVGPRLYGHAPHVLLGQSEQFDEIAQQPEEIVHVLEKKSPGNSEGRAASSPSGQVAPHDAGASVRGGEGARNAAAQSSRIHHAESPRAESLNDGGASDAAAHSPVDGADERAQLIREARESGIPVLERNVEGLRSLAQLIGEDTPLLAHSDLLLPQGLVLSKFGNLRAGGASYQSPEDLFRAYSVAGDSWALLRLSDRMGPTLAESLDEVNLAMIREYHSASARENYRHRH